MLSIGGVVNFFPPGVDKDETMSDGPTEAYVLEAKSRESVVSSPELRALKAFSTVWNHNVGFF